MQITILGATGKVGSLVVANALRQEIRVRAFVHKNPQNLPDSPLVSYIIGDVLNESDVERAIIGSDVVVCTLSSWGSKNKRVLSTCMKHLIPAMEKQGIKRLITLTGAEAQTTKEQPTFTRKLTHTLFSTLAHGVLFDAEEHIRLLAASSLDCTILRSPIMTSDDAPGYEIGLRPPKIWQTIPRKNVALAILQLALTDAYIKQAPFVTRPVDKLSLTRIGGLDTSKFPLSQK